MLSLNPPHEIFILYSSVLASIASRWTRSHHKEPHFTRRPTPSQVALSKIKEENKQTGQSVVFAAAGYRNLCCTYHMILALLEPTKCILTLSRSLQGKEFLGADDIFSHSDEKRVPLKPPVRKALAMFSGKRNPNDNHFSRSKH